MILIKGRLCFQMRFHTSNILPESQWWKKTSDKLMMKRWVSCFIGSGYLVGGICFNIDNQIINLITSLWLLIINMLWLHLHKCEELLTSLLATSQTVAATEDYFHCRWICIIFSIYQWIIHTIKKNLKSFFCWINT